MGGLESTSNTASAASGAHSGVYLPKLQMNFFDVVPGPWSAAPESCVFILVTSNVREISKSSQTTAAPKFLKGYKFLYQREFH